MSIPIYYERVCGGTTIRVAEFKIRRVSFVVDRFLEKFKHINLAVDIIQTDKY